MQFPGQIWMQFDRQGAQKKPRDRVELAYGVALEKTDTTLVRRCPYLSVVLGHVGDIGEPVKTDIPFERVSTTTYPNQRAFRPYR